MKNTPFNLEEFVEKKEHGLEELGFEHLKVDSEVFRVKMLEVKTSDLNVPTSVGVSASSATHDDSVSSPSMGGKAEGGKENSGNIGASMYLEQLFVTKAPVHIPYYKRTLGNSEFSSNGRHNSWLLSEKVDSRQAQTVPAGRPLHMASPISKMKLSMQIQSQKEKLESAGHEYSLGPPPGFHHGVVKGVESVFIGSDMITTPLGGSQISPPQGVYSRVPNQQSIPSFIGGSLVGIQGLSSSTTTTTTGHLTSNIENASFPSDSTIGAPPTNPTPASTTGGNNPPLNVIPTSTTSSITPQNTVTGTSTSSTTDYPYAANILTTGSKVGSGDSPNTSIAAEASIGNLKILVAEANHNLTCSKKMIIQFMSKYFAKEKLTSINYWLDSIFLKLFNFFHKLANGKYVDRSLCEQEVRELRIKLTEATNRTQNLEGEYSLLNEKYLDGKEQYNILVDQRTEERKSLKLQMDLLSQQLNDATLEQQANLSLKEELINNKSEKQKEIDDLLQKQKDTKLELQNLENYIRDISQRNQVAIQEDKKKFEDKLEEMNEQIILLQNQNAKELKTKDVEIRALKQKIVELSPNDPILEQSKEIDHCPDCLKLTEKINELDKKIAEKNEYILKNQEKFSDEKKSFESEVQEIREALELKKEEFDQKIKKNTEVINYLTEKSYRFEEKRGVEEGVISEVIGEVQISSNPLFLLIYLQIMEDHLREQCRHSGIIKKLLQEISMHTKLSVPSLQSTEDTRSQGSPDKEEEEEINSWDNSSFKEAELNEELATKLSITVEANSDLRNYLEENFEELGSEITQVLSVTTKSIQQIKEIFFKSNFDKGENPSATKLDVKAKPFVSRKLKGEMGSISGGLNELERGRMEDPTEEMLANRTLLDVIVANLCKEGSEDRKNVGNALTQVQGFISALNINDPDFNATFASLSTGLRNLFVKMSKYEKAIEGAEEFVHEFQSYEKCKEVQNSLEKHVNTLQIQVADKEELIKNNLLLSDQLNQLKYHYDTLRNQTEIRNQTERAREEMVMQRDREIMELPSTIHPNILSTNQLEKDVIIYGYIQCIRIT